jgi:hypothetical protein
MPKGGDPRLKQVSEPLGANLVLSTFPATRTREEIPGQGEEQWSIPLRALLIADEALRVEAASPLARNDATRLLLSFSVWGTLKWIVLAAYAALTTAMTTLFGSWIQRGLVALRIRKAQPAGSPASSKPDS